MYELVAGKEDLELPHGGLTTVPCIIVDVDDNDSAVLALIENLRGKI